MQDNQPLTITMTHTIHEQGNDGSTVNKKSRRGEEEDGQQMETEETFRKFGINLGSFRTEAEILAELHLKYPWVKVVRRITRIKEAFDRSEGPQRERVLLPTHRLYVQEDLHLDGSPILHNGGTPPTGRYGTRRHTDDKVEQQYKIGKPHRHGEGSLTGKEQSARFIGGYGSFRLRALCERASTVLQLPEVRPPCQDLQVGSPNLQILRRKASLPPM